MSKYIANAFQIPNAVVDDLMSRLSPNAFKCYVLIVRKTTGWGKSSDKISISQFQAIAGIKKRDTVQPPSGGCELKRESYERMAGGLASRLRAAVS